MCAAGLGHGTGTRWCWQLQMLSLAPLVPGSKEERSSKSSFPLKHRLERLYLFTKTVYLLSRLEALSHCACRQRGGARLAGSRSPLPPTLPGAEMGRKTPVASMCWGCGLAWWALQGGGSALPVPAGSLAQSIALCSLEQRERVHQPCRTGTAASGQELVSPGQTKPPVHGESCCIAVGAMQAWVGAGRGARAACFSCRCWSWGLRLPRGASGCGCKRLLRLHVVAGGQRYKCGHVSGRGPGHPLLTLGEAPSASQMQHSWCRGPEPAVQGKPVSLRGSSCQVELLTLMLSPQ